MCGRYTSTSDVEALVEAFGVAEVRTPPLPARWNVAPTTDVYAVACRSRVRTLGTFRWGLVPSWAKDPGVGSRMINARAEGIAGRPAYRRALTRRRCVIPADAFYEWQVVDVAGAVRPRPAKLPWAIRRSDRAPMGLAGLWEVWRDPSADEHAEPLRTCTIVTTVANEALSPIHHRMPVVLDAEGLDAWLDPDLIDGAAIEGLLVPAPPALFEAWPVSTLVNKVAVEGPELLEPLVSPPR